VVDNFSVVSLKKFVSQNTHHKAFLTSSIKPLHDAYVDELQIASILPHIFLTKACIFVASLLLKVSSVISHNNCLISLSFANQASFIICSNSDKLFALPNA
jgi:hypothetical protein